MVEFYIESLDKVGSTKCSVSVLVTERWMFATIRELCSET